MGDVYSFLLNPVGDFLLEGERNVEELLVIDILFLRLEVEQVEGFDVIEVYSLQALHRIIKYSREQIS